MKEGFNRLRSVPVALFGASLLLLDLVTKWLTAHFLPLAALSQREYPYGGIGVFRNFLGIEFSLNHVTNTGAIWGLLNDHVLMLLLFRGLAVIGLFGWLLLGEVQRGWLVPLVMVLVGALGNVLDVLIYGHVVDMFHFRLWGWDYPWFNIADACILVGVIWMCVLSWGRRSSRSVSRS